MTQEAAVPPGFWGRVQKMIDDSIARFARSGFLRNASITDGGLTIKGGGSLTVEDNGSIRVRYPDGTSSVYAGDIYGVESNEYSGTGLLVQGPDGRDIAHIRSDAATGNTSVVIRDAQGNAVFSTDRISGQGLAGPFLNGGFARARFTDFTVAANTDQFVTLWRQWVTKEQARLEVAYMASMDTSGTTGEVRVLVDGVQLGSTTAEGFAVGTRYILGSVAGAHRKALNVEIQARRIGTTGALRVEPLYYSGRPAV